MNDHANVPQDAPDGPTDTSAEAASAAASSVDAAPTPRADVETSAPLDLETIEQDLAGVEAALRRLDDGSYWTDEITGEPIPDEVLDADPVARRAG